MNFAFLVFGLGKKKRRFLSASATPGISSSKFDDGEEAVGLVV
jgi:hypothetical protein